MTRRCRPAQPPPPFNRFTRPIATMTTPTLNAPPPRVDTDALVLAIGNAVGTDREAALLAELRRAAPDHWLFTAYDRIAADAATEVSRTTPHTLSWKQWHDARFGADPKLREIARQSLEWSLHTGNAEIALWPLCRAIDAAVQS